MGKMSVRENKSVYQLLREKRSLTRRDASQLTEPLGLSEYRLVKIEDGSVAVQPADAVAMSRAYSEPALRNHYCRHECPIGMLDAPEAMYQENVHEILVNVSVTLERLNLDKARLMEILADAEVSRDEKKDFEDISRELEKISSLVESLQLWCEKSIEN